MESQWQKIMIPSPHFQRRPDQERAAVTVKARALHFVRLGAIGTTMASLSLRLSRSPTHSF